MIVQIDLFEYKNHTWMLEYIFYCKQLAKECLNIILPNKIPQILRPINIFVNNYLNVFEHPKTLSSYRVKLLFILSF